MSPGESHTHAASDGKFRSLLEAAPDAFVIVGVDGRIEMVNAQAELLFGYAREELLGQEVDVLVPERFRGQHPSHRQRYTGDPRRRPMGTGVELSGRRKDGSEFPAEISLAPVHTADGVVVMTAIRDVTERVRLERRLVEASRLKSEFLANMSHELRSPLNAIIGFTDLMYRGKAGPISDEHKEYLGDVLASSRHLLLLINDVLDLAKVESGKMEFVPERVDIEELADEVRDVVRGLILNRDLAITVDVDPAIGAVDVDPSRTRQILYNYLSNAIKFTPDGGAIRVRVRGEGPEFFRIEVEDSGVGIAADDVARLFVAFQQLDPGSSKRYAGTGLGLALTKRIAEAQGGRVDVHSAPGGGSTFAVTLPRHAGAPNAAERHRVPPAIGSRTVLVIDDDRMSLHLANAALREAGFTPICLSDPEQALAVAEREPLAAIVVDLLMPALNGFELAAQLRQIVRPELPLIAWTVKDLSRGERMRLQSGAVAVVGKDATGADGLVSAVQAMTRHDTRREVDDDARHDSRRR